MEIVDAILIVIVLVTSFVAWSVEPSIQDSQREREMSKRRIQKRHRELREKAEDDFTNTIERGVSTGRYTRSEADHLYRRLKKIGFKDLGLEPSFGKPWYYKPFVSDPKATLARLRNKFKRKEVKPIMKVEDVLVPRRK